ncbi:hypothetical protein FA15DRAFT_661351 [Coprinopsis marcescibilis]|uniref:Uncharacterized protein n=1 Tax=Coprinopsis marcescibilis TaxID=230819 RepID=A0A5C3KBW3_COPMA|nr:hypothetical protein FA15DRAFT_661351 [Coprinopsis marcescibilis]
MPVTDAQQTFLRILSPYYRQAKARGEEAEFLSTMYSDWFRKWVIKPEDYGSWKEVEEEISLKKQDAVEALQTEANRYQDILPMSHWRAFMAANDSDWRVEANSIRTQLGLTPLEPRPTPRKKKQPQQNPSETRVGSPRKRKQAEVTSPKLFPSESSPKKRKI